MGTEKRIVTLGSILHMEKGKKPVDQSVSPKPGFLPYVDIKAFEQGIIDNYASTEKSLRCKDGDLLIVCDGSRSGLTGIAVKGIVGSTLSKIYADGLTTEYLRYFIQSKYTLLNTRKKGTGTPHLDANILKSSKIYIPSREEQEKTVARIEELSSNLDEAVQTLQEIKKQLTVYRQSVLKDAYQGKLTIEWRKNHSKKLDFHEVNIQNILAEEKNALKAGPFGSALKKECYSETGYKIYGQEQVIAGDETIGDYYISEEKYHELETCKIKPNDILISLVGTVGRVLILSENCQPGIINPRLIKITLDQKKMLPMFFKYYFESAYLKSIYKAKVHGATMEVMNSRILKELPFVVCDIDEQQEVVGQIESRLSICDNIEKTVDDSLTEAEALRQSILKKAFEGRLV